MSSYLQRIFEAKRLEVEARRQRRAPELVAVEATHRRDSRPFRAALLACEPAIIAEIKRASPSKGDIFPELDPVAVAREYEAAGAAALSVLTDRHFKGSLDDLRAVRHSVSLPVLCKDFIFDDYQLYEARAAGADCILLIAAMLKKRELERLAVLAEQLVLAALIEVHDRAEFALAQDLGAPLIGINNRNLHSFNTDLKVSEDLLEGYRGDALIIAESGIQSPADLRRLRRAGARAFLVGEGLLRDGKPGESLSRLISSFRPA